MRSDMDHTVLPANYTMPIMQNQHHVSPTQSQEDVLDAPTSETLASDRLHHR